MQKAIDKSIMKWVNIVTGKGSDNRTRNCELCRQFRSQAHCDGCPVAILSDEACFYTPYEHWIDHHYEEHSNEHEEINNSLKIECNRCKELAVMEVWFLQRVLEEYK